MYISNYQILIILNNKDGLSPSHRFNLSINNKYRDKIGCSLLVIIIHRMVVEPNSETAYNQWINLDEHVASNHCGGNTCHPCHLADHSGVSIRGRSPPATAR